MPRAAWTHRLPIAGLLLLGLAGCSSAPFPTQVPSDAGELATEAAIERDQLQMLLAEPDAEFLSICYGSQVNTPGEVLALARELCLYGGRISKVSEDSTWNRCALLQPTRVTFACVPGEPPASVYQ